MALQLARSRMGYVLIHLDESSLLISVFRGLPQDACHINTSSVPFISI